MSRADGALPITVIDVPGGGRLGLSHCPGRCGGPYGQRDLAADLKTIEDFGADILLTFVEAAEFTHLGVPAFANLARNRHFRWHHVPIPDFGAPTAATLAAWDVAKDDVRTVLDGGGRLALHCAAGLGRTGMMAAKLLSERGMSPEAAIADVRHCRPGAVETDGQVAFVMHGPRLLHSRSG